MNRIECRVPEGVSGDWRVESFTISEENAKRANIRAIFNPLESVEPGNYKRLMRGGTVVMSNTPMEIETNRPIIRNAIGNVLINGLGLGMVLEAILLTSDVTSVTVVEKSPDVIALVAPSFKDEPRVKIINADAFEYTPAKGQRFDAVWHDIWDTICGDNVLSMTKLARKYARRTDWQGAWCKEECVEANRRWAKERWRYLPRTG